MNVNRMLTFLLRRFVRQGINAGIDRAYGVSKSRKDMSPEERAQHNRARQNSKRSKQAMKMMRRFGRF